MTISIEQAKKLHELGVMKASEKRWYGEEIDGIVCWETEYTKSYNVPSINKPYAYNAEELVGMMKYMGVTLEQKNDVWYCYTYDGEPEQIYATIYGATLTEALGNKLICDLENGIVSLEEVNR